MTRFNKQLRRCRKAVSDIIGNLLILAITVTLFSSILFYVGSMPPPQELTYAEMNYSLSDLSEDGRWINVTHKGGQVLHDWSTSIYIDTGSNVMSLKISNSTTSLGDEWVTGETWTYRLVGIDQNTPIRVLIVDDAHNVIVWEAQMVGGLWTDFNAPIITTRGTNPSIIIDGASFTFYASVIDPNGDFDRSSVYIDASSIGLGNVPLLDDNNDGMFVSAAFNGNIAMNDKVVVIFATDLSGKTSASQMTLKAQYSGGGGSENNYDPLNNYSSYFVNGTYPPDASGGESGGQGGQSGTIFYYIRRASDNLITRSFEPGENLYIEVYSDKLTNLAIENAFYMYNPATGTLLSPQTKLVNAFVYGGIFSSFHRYVINLSAPEQPLVFPLQIALRDNAGTVVNIADSISVAGATYPIILTYKLNEASGLLQQCTSFNHTDVVYLKIFTKDVDSSVTAVVLNDLQINDYTGRYIIKKAPPAPNVYTTNPAPALALDPPLSQIYKTSKTTLNPARLLDSDTVNSVYTLQINLLRANQAWWLPGENHYSLFIPVFTDSGNSGIGGETYYKLNYQFNLTAPKTTTDIVASIGSGSYTWSASGAAWDDNGLAWFKNGERFDQWDRINIATNTYDGPIGMELVDVDNDGRKDLVVGFQDASVAIAWYRNEKVDASKWSALPYVISAPFDAHPGTQNAGGTNKGLANEDSTVWATGYIIDRFENSYLSLNEIVGSIRSGDFNGDGTLDLVASFVHPVVHTSAEGSEDADYTNSFGMFFNRGIYIFWNDGNWTRTQLDGTDAYTNEDTNPAALDLAVGDLNRDGVDDIVAVYETGATKIWLNQWKQVIGNSADPKADSFGVGSLVPVGNVPAIPGTDPWDHAQRVPAVVIADVDRNGYMDIIRTSSFMGGGVSSVYIIRTIPTTPTEVTATPNNQYGAGSDSANVTGVLSDISANDANYMALTEVYKNTSVLLGLPYLKDVTDDTGQNLNDLKYDDGVTYNVNPSQTLHIRSFLTESTYSTKPITEVTLHVKYSATADYTGDNFMSYSLGSTYMDTTFQPSSSSLNVNATYDLLLQGVDTWSEIESFRARFINNGASGTVQFDYLRLEVRFADTRWMEQIFEIPNAPTQITHQLGMSAYVPSAGEAFEVHYSTDGVIWYTAFTFSGAVEETKQVMLPHTTNSLYYVKVSAADSSLNDVTNDTLMVNLLSISHRTDRVYWPGPTITVTFTVGDGEYITCLAAGDVGSGATDPKPDRWPDIIVGTSNVGSGTNTRTLMISTNNGGVSFDSPSSVLTTGMAAAVGNNNAIYNTQAIALGDFNGDGYTDIAITLGFAPGRSGGTAPSIWLYRNDPLVGGWQWGEQSLNQLSTGESAINIQAGNVDLTILYPLLGVLGLVATEGAIRRIDRRRK